MNTTTPFTKILEISPDYDILVSMHYMDAKPRIGLTISSTGTQQTMSIQQAKQLIQLLQYAINE